MPFDGTGTRGILALYILDRMEEAFGENGEGWICGLLSFNNGERKQHCLLGQLRFSRQHEHIKGDMTGRFLLRAIRQIDPKNRGGIMEYNDSNGYSRIKLLLDKTRELIKAEMER